MPDTRIAQVLRKHGTTVFPGCYDTLSAKLVERAGFPMSFISGYSVAAMTDPDFPGQRPFYRMGEHLYRGMEEQGFAFVAGFSNKNSFRLMTGPLRRTPIRLNHLAAPRA